VYEQVYLPAEPGVELRPIQKQLEGALLKIYTTSLELLADSAKLLDANTVRRTIEAIVNPGQFGGQLSGLTEDEDELLRDVQACEVQRSSDADNTMIDMLKTFNDPMIRLDEGIAHLLAHMSESDRIEMLEWISPVPFGRHHDGVSEDRTPGTGNWLLQHQDFQSWEKANSSLLFWLQGSPGTGKTYLTSGVIDHIRSRTKNEGFAFFYCRKGEESRSQPQSILQSFVRQLSTNANNPESVQIKLRDAVNTAREKGTNFRLQQCKEQILVSLNIYAKSTLVIDALDECDPDTRDELVEELNSFIQDAEKPVKIFISSRPDPGLAAELQRRPSIEIQAGDNQDDIQKYLEVELDKRAKTVSVLKRMKEEMMDTLLERAKGMFLWAVLQVHQLVKCRSAPSVRDRLNKLPASLKDSYDEVWAQINSLEDHDRAFAVRALHWVAVAIKPLSSPEILSAIRMDPNGTIMPVETMLDENGLLSLCNGFLTVDPQLQEWRFPHLSVQEYLESENHVSGFQGHLEAGMVSLSYFVHNYEDLDLEDGPEPEEFKASNAEEAPTPADMDGGFAKMHPFHIYMRHCWIRHVQIADATEASELAPLLKAFLGSPNESTLQYQRWLRQITKDFDILPTEGKFGYCWERHYGGYPLGYLLSAFCPEDAAVFAMIRFSFDLILASWWEEAEIDLSRRNHDGHHLLAIAANVGSLLICKSLLSRGFDVNARCEGIYHGTGLVAAAACGNLELVKYLVEGGADAHIILPEGEGQFRNALSAAVDSGSVETTRYLIEDVGVDVRTPLPRSMHGLAVLGMAAATPGIEMTKLILDAGADVDTRVDSHCGPTALTIKIRFHELESIKYLVQTAKADVNICGALEYATMCGNLDILKFLVEAGADINGRTTSGTYGSPLAAASSHSSHFAALEFLLASGADLNLPLLTGDFGSALAVACAEGGPEVVRRLLSAGADPNMPLTRGRCGSALAWAAFASLNVDIVKALVDAGADVNMPLEHGEFGSALAAGGAGYGFPDDTEVFPYLIQAGAEINMPLKYGFFGSAFAATAWRGRFDKIKLLVDKGADVHMRLEENDFPNPLAIIVTSTWGDQILEYIRELGVDINPKYPGKRYGSPLIAAAAFGKRGCVEYLLDNGAEVNAKYEGSYYSTALQAARASFELEDTQWMQRYIGHNPYENVETFAEVWAEEKPGIVELLLERGATA
jgi:ankyrin repeat protein